MSHRNQTDIVFPYKDYSLSLSLSFLGKGQHAKTLIQMNNTFLRRWYWIIDRSGSEFFLFISSSVFFRWWVNLVVNNDDEERRAKSFSVWDLSVRQTQMEAISLVLFWLLLWLPSQRYLRGIFVFLLSFSFDLEMFCFMEEHHFFLLHFFMFGWLENN